MTIYQISLIENLIEMYFLFFNLKKHNKINFISLIIKNILIYLRFQ